MGKISVIKIVSALFIVGIGIQIVAVGVPAFSQSASDTVTVTLTVDSGITISNGTDVTMAPNIGISNNTSIGSSSWIVRTNDPDGYTLSVKASASPALTSGGDSFADYTEAVNGTPEAWSIDSGAYEFGYSAYGTDVNTTTWGTGASCGSSGIPDSAQKYVGFKTTDKTIATRTSSTTSSGITTNICFAAGQNAVYAPAGAYTATITATATVL